MSRHVNIENGHAKKGLVGNFQAETRLRLNWQVVRLKVQRPSCLGQAVESVSERPDKLSSIKIGNWPDRLNRFEHAPARRNARQNVITFPADAFASGSLCSAII